MFVVLSISFDANIKDVKIKMAAIPIPKSIYRTIK